jgi:hypothetical protein
MSTRPTAARWVRARDALWRRLPDGVLVLTPALATPLAVTGSAAAVWDLLAVPTDTDTMCERLAHEHPDAPSLEHVRSAVDEVLETLVDAGAVVAAGPGAEPT